MPIEHHDLWRRVKDAGRTSGLNAGLRSWIKELRKDYPAAHAKATAIRGDLPEPEARAALLREAKSVFTQAHALQKTGLFAERKRRMATREISTLANEAVKLEPQVGDPPNIVIRYWEAAALHVVRHPQQDGRDREALVADIKAALRSFDEREAERKLSLAKYCEDYWQAERANTRGRGR